MRKLLIVAIVALIGSVPMTGYAQTQGQSPTVAKPPSETPYPYVVALGAIAGIVGSQYILFGPAGFPFWASTVTPGAPIPAVISVGVSRIFAITSAATGALLANWAYDH
jgi:membrane associated rhomboid family serine protease